MADVKVRLSVEGAPEAIAAMRAFSAQSHAAGKQAEDGFSGLAKGLEGVRGLLGGLGVALTVGEFVKFTKETISLAVEQKHLAQQIGTTVEHMSALSYAATLTDTDSKVLTAGMGLLGKNLDALKAGIPGMVAAFGRLKNARDEALSAKDFTSNDIAVNAMVLANALHQVADGQEKSAIMTGLAGRNGKALIPVLEKLAQLSKGGGIDTVVDVAKKTGFFVDEATVGLVERLNEQIKLLGLYSRGASIEFLRGFGPQLAQTMEEMTTHVSGQGSAFQYLGEVAGALVRTFKAFAMTIAFVVDSPLTGLILGLGAVGTLMMDVLHHDWQKFVADGKDAFRVTVNTGLNAWKGLGKAWADIVVAPPPIPPAGPTGGDKDAADKEAQRQKHLARLQQAAAQELKLEQDFNAALLAEDQRAYDAGGMSLDQYLADQRQKAQANYDAKVKEIARLRVLAQQVKDPEDRAGTMAALNSEELAARQELSRNLTNIDRSGDAERLALAKQLLQDRAALDDSEANRYAIALDAIAAKQKKFQDDLVKSHVPLADATAQAQAAGDVARADALFKHLMAQANVDLQAFEDKRKKIESDMAAHVITQADGKKQLAKLDTDQLPGLDAIVEKMREIAQALGPEAVAAVNHFAATIANLKVKTADFGVEMKGAFQSGLSSFLASGINQVHSLTDAISQMILSIAQAIQQLVAMRIAKAATTFLFGAAEGGLILGPGTGTSDSIPARLSNGEYVMPARVVRTPGALQALESMRQGSLTPRLLSPTRGYADGGLVSPAAAAPVQATLGGQITIALDEGLIAKSIESPEVQRALLRVAGKNRRAYSQALGR